MPKSKRKKPGLKELFPGVFELKGKVYTKNLAPGEKVYGEQLAEVKGVELREWNPFRSKLCAAIKKGLRSFPFAKGGRVLYLGSASGTTVSHLSDIVGEEGLIFGVDVSAREMQKFLLLCGKRKNLVPILASASRPEQYLEFIEGKVDVLYQDVSQKNQAEIFLKNADFYLKKKGLGLICLKARSIDVAAKPEKVFRQEKAKLEQGFEILQLIPLKPFEKDHVLIVGRLK